MGDQGELIPRQGWPVRIANLTMKLAEGSSVKQDTGRMLTWPQVICRGLWPTQQFHWGGVGLVWGRKAPTLAAAFVFDVDRKGKTSGGWPFSGMAGTWRNIAAFQVFYCCIGGMSRENIPRYRSRTLRALESGEWREELSVWLGLYLCGVFSGVLCFCLFVFLRMQLDEFLVVPLRMWIRKPRWYVWTPGEKLKERTENNWKASGGNKNVVSRCLFCIHRDPLSSVYYASMWIH